ncbi:MAG: ribosomal protein L13e [Candidatus Lokiarchaeota archaeon]|nr:ribosomal protein L13e [Candidatus Lokiarchaeota archaeon]
MSNEQEGANVFKVEPGVGKPVRGKLLRKGRGFSRLELQEACGTVFEAQKFGILVDTRRKSVHDFNVNFLKQLLEEERARKVKAELEKEIVEEKYKELMQVRGIGLSSAEILVDMGITSVEELAAFEVDKLEMDLPITTLKRWVRNAKKHLGEEVEEEGLEEIEAELEEIEEEDLEEMEAELDKLEEAELEELEAELEEIGAEEEIVVEEAPGEELEESKKEEIYKELMQVRGIGKKTAQKIVELGATSIEELAALEVDMMPETADVSTKTVRTWIKNAQKHLEREKKEEKEEETEEITDEELDRIEAELDKLEDLED